MLNEKWEAQKFKPGQSGNPAGTNKGGVRGRNAVLLALDVMLAEEKSQKTMINALRADMNRNPVKFFKEIVMPLLPKESRGSLESGDRVIEWRSLLTVCEPAAKPVEVESVCGGLAPGKAEPVARRA